MPKKIYKKPAKKPAKKQAVSRKKSTSSATDSARFPIVGIGASAGGLNAYKAFFSHMPADSNMAFILVPHLDPSHQSLMVELIAKHTAMPVSEVIDNQLIEANHVYVIPPAHYLVIKNNMLQLVNPPERRGAETAIDSFLRSLAVNHQERAIGIVLSGTGSHGTSGLQAIKANGGMAMVQNPDTAEYSSMPQNAIDTGCIDYILSPEEMPDVLIKYVEHAYVRGELKPEQLLETEQEQLNRILALLRARIKYDFRCYRKNMLLRRIQRRMGLNHIDQLAEYLDLLRDNSDEVDRLYHDLLISVTGFFRDSEAYRVLQQRVIPYLVERNSGETPVRVWIPGCATGEEAYSIAILLIEQFAAVKKTLNIQIYASDIDENALEFARQGIYPESIAVDVSAKRLLQFFTATDSHYQVKKQLRESIVFAAQNLISDAPFSKLDLICCRNLLIYLEPNVQQKVISLFHFSLNEDGFLFLGTSETIGRQVDMFDTISKKWRIFRRIGPTRRDLIKFPIVSSYTRRGLLQPLTEDSRSNEFDFAALTHRKLLEDYGPASTLINRKYEILYFYGATGYFLEAPTGEPTRNLISMAREGLRTKLRAACHKAISENQAVTDTTARVKSNNEWQPCTLTVKPIVDPKQAEGLLLVSFQLREDMPASAPDQHENIEEESGLVKQLEYELKSTREDLQSTIEEMESSNEELKASNEEIMSMNEELQSSNEELETSKEELQSLNEELSTVNNQLQEKVEQLDKAGDDVLNLLNSSNIATLFLDTHFRIRQFTPATGRLLRLISTDSGRAINTFATEFTGADLLEDARLVLEKLSTVEKEIHTSDDHFFLRRCQPYRTSDNRIEGVIVTFIDITERVKSEAQSRRLAAVMRDSNDAVTLHDFDGNILNWNQGAEMMYGYSETEALKMNIRDLIPSDRQEEELGYIRQAASGKHVSSYDTQRLTKDGRVLDIWMTVTTLKDESDQPVAIATTERDISERKTIDELRAQSERLQMMVENLPVGAVYVSSGSLSLNRAVEELTGYKRDELNTLDMWFTKLYGEDAQAQRDFYDAERTINFPKKSMPIELIRKDGGKRFVEFVAYRFDDHEVWLIQDVTERTHFEKRLVSSEERLLAIMDNAAESIIVIDQHGIMTDFNHASVKLFGYKHNEAIGNNVSLLMPSPYREQHDDYLARYLNTRDSSIMQNPRELPALHKDGSIFPIELNVTEIGHLGLFCGIIRDLSKQKSLEREVADVCAQEQDRIGQDIHDGIGQQLTGLNLMISSLKRELAREGIPQSEKLEEIMSYLHQATEDARYMSRGLAPLSIETLGLKEAIELLAQETEKATGIKFIVDIPRRFDVENEGVSIQIYRIIQEAINNAVKHAEAKNITIKMKDTDKFTLIINDDGKGFKVSEKKFRKNLGLRIMRYRAGIIGCNLAIKSELGRGTTVQCTGMYESFL